MIPNSFDFLKSLVLPPSSNIRYFFNCAVNQITYGTPFFNFFNTFCGGVSWNEEDSSGIQI